jgi:hypothetical protein
MENVSSLDASVDTVMDILTILILAILLAKPIANTILNVKTLTRTDIVTSQHHQNLREIANANMAISKIISQRNVSKRQNWVNRVK